jgi:hypothetical protein
MLLRWLQQGFPQALDQKGLSSRPLVGSDPAFLYTLFDVRQTGIRPSDDKGYCKKLL